MPSIGSTTQRTPLVPSRAAPSSPSTPSSGRAASSRPTISSSLALSTAVTTSTGLDLTSTCSAAVARPRATSSAASRAVATASSSSCGGGRGPSFGWRSRGGSCRSRTAGPRAHYPVGVQGFGVDIGGSGIKGCLVDLEIGQLVGERVRIETPQPSLPDPVYGVVARDRRLLRLDRADRRHLPRRDEARRRAHRGERRQELDRHRRRRGPVEADPRRRRHAQRRRRGRASPRCATAPAATSGASSSC